MQTNTLFIVAQGMSYQSNLEAIDLESQTQALKAPYTVAFAYQSYCYEVTKYVRGDGN